MNNYEKRDTVIRLWYEHLPGPIYQLGKPVADSSCGEDFQFKKKKSLIDD